MATRSRGNYPGGRRRRMPLGVVCLTLGLAVMAAMPGCGGCRKTPAQAKKTQEELEKELIEGRAKKKKKPKPNFEVSRLMTLPREGRTSEADLENETFDFGPPYKPGHWTGTTLAAKANHFDFPGELELVVTDGKGRPTPLVAVPFQLTSTCQAVLPKGQWKFFESVLFVPLVDQTSRVTFRLDARRSRRSAHQVSGQPLHRMPSYQYHFVVLARWPERYTYLKSLDSVKLPSDNSVYSEPVAPYYRVSLMPTDQRVALPSGALSWTSIACVLWDDAEPSALDLGQQQALLDWLHWGGQLILSGPDTLDTLRDSFLSPYLPAAAAEMGKLGAADFAELHEWSNRGKSQPIAPLKQVQAWTGIRLQKHPQARFVPDCGELLVERRVGRGRIVASAFHLSGRGLTSWAGLDEWYNALLLRRPPRVFEERGGNSPRPNRIMRSRGPVAQGTPAATPGGNRPEGNNGPGILGGGGVVDIVDTALEVGWAPEADGGRRGRLDARFVSNLRYFTRDMGVTFDSYGKDVVGQDEESFERPPTGPGLAAWNDFSPVANAARAALLSAAQIEIPKSSFVVWMVAGYLLVLVPANWGVFRLINRVEWAWVAAPVIAVACTVVVIQQAQLDIGFARSRTEITVVELQSDYARAHVTRYTALYTSLGTPYDFHLDGPGALVQPFPSVADPQTFRRDATRRLLYRRGKEASLLGFRVDSNATDLVHSEQMVDLAGALSYTEGSHDSFQLVNRTELMLHDVGVIRKVARGNSEIVETAWLGTLDPETRRDGRFEIASPDVNGGRFWQKKRDGSAATRIQLQSGELGLRQLIDLAQDVEGLRRGQVRLVAWLDQPIPGVTIDPAAPQSRHAALVVAQLKYGFGEDPQPDKNTRENPGKTEP